jgi:hypothetical protein
MVAARVFSGMNADEHGLLGDIGLRGVFKPVSNIGYDWMHCLVSSGGYMSYAANEVVRRVLECGFRVGDLDRFAERCVSVGGASPKKNLFSSGFNPQPCSFLKLHAGPTIMAIDVLHASNAFGSPGPIGRLAVT